LFVREEEFLDMRYRPVDPKVDLPELERRVLEFWKDQAIFEKSLKRREDAPRWIFYEGPPTANGRPGIHHVEARTFKDIYPRYKTMTGHFVARKAGWDCHGLPVEVEVEKEIGTKHKRDIERFGIAEFIRLCRESVTRYVEEWERLTERIGFWIDLDEAYWTMNPEYVQSVWWALKRLHTEGLLFEDFKVTPYCPRCGTSLSDHELAQGYTTVTDPSVYVKFPVVEAQDSELVGVNLVAWTTTPWTLISNLGLAVAPDETYARVHRDGEALVVAEKLRDTLGEGGEVIARFPGSKLVGARYEPPYPNANDPGTHRVVAAPEFVTTEEGTGIVHMAPAFGAEDFDMAKRQGWPMFNPVDDEGNFTDLAPEFVRSKFVKDADPEIIEDLRRRGLLVKAEEYEHAYPLCWRCKTPLLYYARPAWYIRTTAHKDDLLRANESVNWYPEHIKEGRYGDWLRNNVDWSLSRDRYWGTPLPIWRCGQAHDTAVGSLAELTTLASEDVTGIDPHRPAVDAVTIRCPDCGQEARRVPQVIDTWFDSGAMPYAQWGYTGPGSEGEKAFQENFPAHFVAEAIDQTRGWFYTLMAEAVLLFGQSAYHNVVCLGLIVDKDGLKMSKSLGNIIDPWEVIDRFGADALRWLLVASGSPWSTRRVSPEAVGEVVRQVLLTLWNTYSFFVTYANIDEPDLAAAPPPHQRSELDRWALSQLNETVASVRASMDAYDATAAARRIAQLVDELSNWYVRRSRRRFWDPSRSAGDAEARASKLSAHATLYECLLTISGLLAPLTPFLAEEVYRNLASGDPNAPESVHLTDFPESDPELVDPELDEAMAAVRAIVSLGRQVRTETKVRVRQPLPRAVIHVSGDPSRLQPLLGLVAEELNVKEVAFAESAEELTGWQAKPNFRELGPRLGSRVQEVAEALAADDGTLAAQLARGETVAIPVRGESLTLGPADVELAQKTRSGWGVASDGAVTVALDLDLDAFPALQREGMVREVIHHVQNLRKSSGLEVADRIELELATDPVERLAYALSTHASLIAGEVLATDVQIAALDGEIGDWDGTTLVEIDGVRTRISLRKA
jgi:isoleucyl-tRNA synthetase